MNAEEFHKRSRTLIKEFFMIALSSNVLLSVHASLNELADLPNYVISICFSITIACLMCCFYGRSFIVNLEKFYYNYDLKSYHYNYHSIWLTLYLCACIQSYQHFQLQPVTDATIIVRIAIVTVISVFLCQIISRLHAKYYCDKALNPRVKQFRTLTLNAIKESREQRKRESENKKNA